MPRRRQPLKDFRKLEGMRAALYCRVSQIAKRGGEDADEQRRAADERSVDDQEREGKAWAEREGVTLVVEPFRDEGLSASAFSAKGRGREARPGFDEMLKLVESDAVDVVWVWAIDRSNRDLRVFTDIREIFQDHQTALSVSGRLHDPNNYDDWMLLGFTSQFGERYSYELSKNVKRGHESQANKGEPHGPVTYGYDRKRSQDRPKGIPEDRLWIDKRTKQFVWQEPKLWDGDGQAIENTPAWIVREIFRRIAAGESTTKIALDLNARGIPLPRAGAPQLRGAMWRSARIVQIATNPAYIGLRVHRHDWNNGRRDAHRSALDVTAKWPPLIDEKTYWAVQRIVANPSRKQNRPAAGKSLLSCLVECGKCGDLVTAGWTGRPGGGRYHVYSCLYRRCTSIKLEALDDYVEEAMIRYLSRNDVAAELTEVDDSATVEQALADAQQARTELEQLDNDLHAGLVSARSHTIAERRLHEVIEEARKRARAATGSPALEGAVGDQAEAAWRSAPLEVKRELIRTLAEIRLQPTGMSAGNARWRPPPMDKRVSWRWLIGPDADQLAPIPADPEPASEPRLLASEVRVLLALVQDGPLLLTELDRRLGMGRGTVGRVIRRMREQGWVAGELQSHRKAVRLIEVAQQAGVSQATVSTVINDRPGPAAATRRAVLEAAAELGYGVHGQERDRGRGRRTATVAITDAGRQVLEQAG